MDEEGKTSRSITGLSSAFIAWITERKGLKYMTLLFPPLALS